MAHFYTTTINSRGNTVSASGTKARGQSTHTRGWDCGVLVEARFESEDVFDIYTTGGSNGGRRRYLGRVHIADGVPAFQEATE